jgi:hypothetical protein
MVNCANDFEPSSLVVQQMEIYYDVRTMVEDLKESWYNDGVQVWDEHKRE